MADVLRGKRHVVVFQTEKGDVVFATDDLEELAQQPFFVEFMNLRPRQAVREVEEPVQQRPVSQPQPVQRPTSPVMQRRPQLDFLAIEPTAMTQELWDSLNQDQKAQYMSKWNR